MEMPLYFSGAALVCMLIAILSSLCVCDVGAPARGERVAKYNRLLQIEEELAAAGLLA